VCDEMPRLTASPKSHFPGAPAAQEHLAWGRHSSCKQEPSPLCSRFRGRVGGLSARARSILQALDPLLAKSLAPLANELGAERCVSRRVAICLLEAPSEAKRTIFAHTTSQWGAVCARAHFFRTAHSSWVGSRRGMDFG
jgi:hypothetical protein